ncbi:platelet-activating factor acetylhydrolase [Xylariaceae sp. FL1019]|nr:platelet-activating factor acetylhydrolase [Xylariaceae sp. FL1019]
MRHNLAALAALCAASTVAAEQISYPKATGPYKVGSHVLELVDETRTDVFSPLGTKRDLMTTLHYPIEDKYSNCTYPSAFTPLLAGYLDLLYSAPLGTFLDFSLPECTDAPVAHPELPLLIFSHGYKGSRLLYQAILQEIASYGYNVLAVDHTYDAVVVEYPDGRFVYNTLDAVASDYGSTELDLNERTKDVIFLLDSLSNTTITSKIPGMVKCGKIQTFQTERAGIFGHSFGGSTSLQSTVNDTRIIAGTSLDGPFWGFANQTGTDTPFMLVSALQPSSEEWIPEWTDTWPRLRNFKRWFKVAGTLHLSFDDLPLLADLLNENLDGYVESETIAATLGNVTGTRMTAIEQGYLTSFFDQFLKDTTNGLLNKNTTQEYPEVTMFIP